MRPDQMRVGVQQDRGLQLSRVHVAEDRGGEARCLARLDPVLLAGEQPHSQRPEVRLLHDVAEHVVAAVPVDEHECGGARRVQGRGHVPHDGGECGGRDAHRSRPRRVLVGARDGDGREPAHGMRGRYLVRQRRGDDSVGGQREVGAVLLEAADGQQRHGRGAVALVERGVGREKVHHVDLLTPPEQAREGQRRCRTTYSPTSLSRSW
ncbi:hypothetical protein GCM10009609_20900 [Pseudonocardia aurantiaca]